MNKPLVSIIIPLYNSEEHIGAAIESSIKQSWSFSELIIIDDGSTDTSYTIAKKYESKKIKLISKKNQGACSARNRGLELAQGDVIQFLDADDLMHPKKIESQINLIEIFGEDIIVFGQWDRFYNSPKEAQFPKRFLDRDWNNPIDWLTNSWEGKGMSAQHSWLTPRKLIEKAGPWDERLNINQDGEFFSRVLLQAKSIKHCAASKVYYRSGNMDSISQKPNREKVVSLLSSYQLYVQNTLPVLDNDKVRHALMMNFLNFIYLHDNYSDLVKIAKKEIISLGFSGLEATGGKTFKKIAKIIGFENALMFRILLRKRKIYPNIMKAKK